MQRSTTDWAAVPLSLTYNTDKFKALMLGWFRGKNRAQLTKHFLGFVEFARKPLPAGARWR
jgi:hypothetical protein